MLLSHLEQKQVGHSSVILEEVPSDRYFVPHTYVDAPLEGLFFFFPDQELMRAILFSGQAVQGI